MGVEPSFRLTSMRSSRSHSLVTVPARSLNYTVTVKYTTNNRNHTVGSKTYAVAARDTLVLKKSDIVPAGFNVTGDLQNATVTNTKKTPV